MSSSAIVITLMQDMMFGLRIEGVLKDAGYTVARYREDAPISALLAEHDAEPLPAIGFVDLTNKGMDPIFAVTRMREAGLAVVGFCGHSDEATRQTGRAAGVTTLVARSEVANNAPQVVERAREWEPDEDCDHC